MKLFASVFAAGMAFSAVAALAQTATNNQTVPVATSGETGQPRLSDAQIAAVLQTTNKGEAEMGVMAVQKASNPEVKSFAQMMVDDHKMALEDSNKLINDYKLKPQKGMTSADINSAGMVAKGELEKLNGADFDKAYINGQIGMHQDVLKTIDTQLLPSAKSAEVKALLQKMRPKIEAHMKHAEEIKKKLKM